jgi:hypothetical protein
VLQSSTVFAIFGRLAEKESNMGFGRRLRKGLSSISNPKNVLRGAAKLTRKSVGMAKKSLTAPAKAVGKLAGG